MFSSLHPSQNIYDSLTSYISEGGMAGSYLHSTEEQRRRYIDPEVLNALIVRAYQPEYQYEGIRIVDAADWLSSPIPQK